LHHHIEKFHSLWLSPHLPFFLAWAIAICIKPRLPMLQMHMNRMCHMAFGDGLWALSQQCFQGSSSGSFIPFYG
jgi:hypothetical protein